MTKEDIVRAKDALLEVLRRPIAYHRAFADIGKSVTAGVFLSQLYYWSDKGKDPDGWVYKTQKEWQEETGLTRREQETARRNLARASVLQEKRRGVPARLYYKIDLDVLIELLADLRQTRMAETDSQECGEAPNQNGGKRQTGMAESAKLFHRLPETTAESKTDMAVAGLLTKNVVMCSIHSVAMERRERDGQAWYSHRLPDGAWCKGASIEGTGNDPHEVDRARYRAQFE